MKKPLTHKLPKNHYLKKMPIRGTNLLAMEKIVLKGKKGPTKKELSHFKERLEWEFLKRKDNEVKSTILNSFNRGLIFQGRFSRRLFEGDGEVPLRTVMRQYNTLTNSWGRFAAEYAFDAIGESRYSTREKINKLLDRHRAIHNHLEIVKEFSGKHENTRSLELVNEKIRKILGPKTDKFLEYYDKHMHKCLHFNVSSTIIR